MKYEDFKNLIFRSNPEDWEFHEEDEFEIYFHKDNILVSIERDQHFDQRKPGNFWYKKLDGNVSTKRFLIKYNGNVIGSFKVALPDDQHLYLPYPMLDNTIRQEEYLLARIINKAFIEDGVDYTEELKQYLTEAGITIV